MLPSARVVLEDPFLYGVSLDAKARGLVTTADKLAINLPLTVAPLKPEGASDALRIGCVGEPVEVGTRRNVRRIDAVVRHLWTIDDDLQDPISLSGAQNNSSWTTSVFLLQAILQ